MRVPSSPGPVGGATVRTVVGSGLVAERAARARVEALARVAHAGVCVPSAVERDGASVVVVAPLVQGPTLAEATDAGIEDLGQWVWLMVRLAEAVAALHEAGLAHGDVAPQNVVMSDVPVLVDLVGAALGGERGTAGFASPERGMRASAADDVHALGMVGRAIAGESVAEEVRAWTAPLVEADPGLRPSARAVARGLPRCAPPEPWRPAHAPGAVAARRVRTRRDPAARWWRVRRAAPRAALVVLGAAIVVGGALWGGPHAVERMTASAAQHPPSTAEAGEATPSDPAGLTSTDPVAAAVALTRARIEAASDGDRDALMRLVVPGSPAWAEASRAATLAEDGASAGEARVSEVEATLTGEEGDAATVRVDYLLGAHTAVAADGTRAEREAARQSVVLELVRGEEGWRVARASPA